MEKRETLRICVGLRLSHYEFFLRRRRRRAFDAAFHKQHIFVLVVGFYEFGVESHAVDVALRVVDVGAHVYIVHAVESAVGIEPRHAHHVVVVIVDSGHFHLEGIFPCAVAKSHDVGVGKQEVAFVGVIVEIEEGRDLYGLVAQTFDEVDKIVSVVAVVVKSDE